MLSTLLLLSLLHRDFAHYANRIAFPLQSSGKGLSEADHSSRKAPVVAALANTTTATAEQDFCMSISCIAQDFPTLYIHLCYCCCPSSILELIHSPLSSQLYSGRRRPKHDNAGPSVESGANNRIPLN